MMARQVGFFIAAALLLLTQPRFCYGDATRTITADSIISLDGTWVATPSTTGVAIPATVPGEIITDLYRAHVIQDPFHDLTWREQAGLWDLQAWTYDTTFQSPTRAANAAVWLVFESVKMAANATLNGKPVGSMTDQHLRYTFPIDSLLVPAGQPNTLSITWPASADDKRNDAGRFMGCSGAWDWAPYSNESSGKTPKGIRSFTKGLVKSVYLSISSSAVITNVKALVTYTGTYPTLPLSDLTADGWRVDVVVYMTSPRGTSGALEVEAAFDSGNRHTTPVTLQPNTETAINISIVVPPKRVSLWWPNTMSAQRPLYSVRVRWVPTDKSSPTISTARSIGFRTLALVTADDSNPAGLAGLSGSGNLTMRFKVNGANLFARGSNWIPLEGETDRHEHVI